MKIENHSQIAEPVVWPPPPSVVEPTPKPPVMKAWKAVASCALVSAVISGVTYEAVMLADEPTALSSSVLLVVAAPLLNGVATALIWRRGNMSRWRRLASMSAAIALLSIIVGLFVYWVNRQGREILTNTPIFFLSITVVELIGLGVMGAILRRRDAKHAAETADATASQPPLS